MDDPAKSLELAENAIRLAIRAAIQDRWQQHVRLDDLTKRQAEDHTRRDGVVVSDDLLSYLEFHQLRTIVRKEWEAFKPVFDDLQRTEVWLQALEDVRNAIAHSRTLVEHEAALVAGISGQIRNQVTLFRSRTEPASAHYAKIERVVDQFGRVGSESATDVMYSASVPPRLEVGETITLNCDASDARGRELQWLARTKNAVNDLADAVEAIGQSVTIRLLLTEQHVGEDVLVHVFVRPVGSLYTKKHRDKLGWDNNSIPMYGVPHDDVRVLRYAVNPPN